MIIKVCGMREPENIEAVSKLPIDYLGFIFYEKSPRFVSQRVRDAAIGQKKVGVFVNADIDFVLSKVIDNQLDIAQLHGSEPPQYLADLKARKPNLTLWKAFSVDADFDFDQTLQYENLADIFLFDTKTPQHGGAGVKFDWSLLEKYKGKTPFLLAGGITPDDTDVVKSLKIKQLAGLDLNSKFEISPAFKDVEKLRLFIQKIKSK